MKTSRSRHPKLTLLRWTIRCLILLASFAVGLIYALACHREKSGPDAGAKDAALRLIHPQKSFSPTLPTEYVLESQPFSPTLANLFDHGRILALPAEHAPQAPEDSPAEKYAFSAIDRFGRVYHFDTLARWWMADGEPLPEPLPETDWDAAWNARTGAIELLVTAPWAGDQNIQLLRWRDGRWFKVKLAKAPPARTGARRLLQAATDRWFVAGGAEDGWMLEGNDWTIWPALQGAGAGFAHTAFLTDGPGREGPVLITQAGDVWLWRGGAWTHPGRIEGSDLALACYDPAQERILLLWSRGMGKDLYLWQSFKELLGGRVLQPELLSQTGQVKINEENEGFWRGWGRAREYKDAIGQTRETFNAGFEGAGEPAILLAGGEYGELILRRSEIETIELPPSLAATAPRAAAYVPALNAVLLPSVCGLGIHTRQHPFFPPAADGGLSLPSTVKPLASDEPTTRAFPTRVDGPTTSVATSGHTISIIERTPRLWAIREKLIEWIKPPFEIHPAIDYLNSYQTIDGRRRCLSWSFPEPGLFRYDFYEYNKQKVQWLHSPLLTLKTLPQVAWAPDATLFLCDPVVWGDPAEVIVVGWCGRLKERIRFDKTPDGLSNEAYEAIPDSGFMARISALTPREWKVCTIPIPFCMGARLVPAPAQNSLYLLGGKMAQPARYEGRLLNFMVSHPYIWHWDGENWERSGLEKDGAPRMKATSQVAYDSASRQLLMLLPRGFYGFDSERWNCLWRRDKLKGEEWPEEVGLYVHPRSGLTLGAWFMPRPTLKVWREESWIPVRMATEPGTQMMMADRATTDTAGKDLRPGGPLPVGSDNLLPATMPDTFVSIDREGLSAMRMDAQRDRDKDRLIEGYLLTFTPANQGGGHWLRGGLPLELPTGEHEPRRTDGVATTTLSTSSTTATTVTTATSLARVTSATLPTTSTAIQAGKQ